MADEELLKQDKKEQGKPKVVANDGKWSHWNWLQKNVYLFDVLGTQHSQETMKTCNYMLVVNFKKLGKPQKMTRRDSVLSLTGRNTNN